VVQLRRLARLAGVLSGLLLIGLLVLHLPSVRGRVLDRVRGYAERELGLALRASGLSYNLLTRTIELRDVSIASTSADRPFVEADRAVVVLGPAIFRGRLAIDQISLGRPRLTLVRYADGTLNLPTSRKDAGQPAPLHLGVVTATALSIGLEDRLSQRSAAVGPFDLSVDTTTASSRPGAFGPGPFNLRAGQIDTAGTIAGRLGFDGSRARLEELVVETGAGRLTLAGWIDVIARSPALSGHASATIDLPEAARLVKVDARGLTGHLEATADISGLQDDPAVTLVLAGRDARAPAVGPIQFSGRSSVRGTRALIERIEMTTGAGALQIEGAIELGDASPTAGKPGSRIAMRWSNVQIDALARAAGTSLALQSGSLAGGSATLEFDIRDAQARAWSRLRATATTTLRPAARGAAGAETLALSGGADLQFSEGRWSLRHSLQAQRTQIELEGNVTGRLPDGADVMPSTIGGRSRLRMADVGVLPPLLQAAGVQLPADASDELAGSILATVDLDGTLARPLARMAIEGRGLRARAWPQPTALEARLDVDRNAVRVAHVQATAGTTSMQASGTYGWRGPFDARVELRDADVSVLAGRYGVPVGVSGSARLEGTISGTLSSTSRRGQAEFVLSSTDLAVEDVSIGTLSATGRIPLEEGGVMSVDVAAPRVGARSRFEIVNRIGYPVSGDVTIDHDQIGALVPHAYREQAGEVTGRLSATARGSGRLSDPAGIRGRIDLRVLDVLARGTPVRLAAPASITVGDDRIAADSVDLRIGQHTRATLGGQLGVSQRPDPLRVHLDGPLSELIGIGTRTAAVAPVAVRGDGTVTLDVTVGGTLSRPMPAGTLAVESPSLEYGTLTPVTGLAIAATIDPTLITLRSVAARWRSASLAAQGTLPWRVILSAPPVADRGPPTSRLAAWLNALPEEPSRAKLTVRADNITQAALNDVLSSERLAQIQGNASATLVAEADRLSLDRVRATVVLDRASITLAEVPFTQSVPTRLRLENGRVRIDDFRWSAEGNSIVATGGADLTAATPSLDLAIAGALDLRVAGAFVSGMASSGTASADLTIAGPYDNPGINGRVTVADGEVQLDSPRLAATDFNGTLQIGGGRTVTVSLAGLINTGSATLDGTIDLANLDAPLGKLQLTGREIALEYPPGLQTASNISLELELGAHPALNGRIDVIDGTYGETVVLSRQLLGLSSTDGIARAAPPAGWLSAIRFNVAVATASDIRIDNNYGRFVVGANLRLVGTPASPGVTGRLQAAEDGEIYLGGNTYRIERLIIDLPNPRAITPDVDFSAQTRIGDLPIGVDLRCPATGPCERKVTSLSTDVDDGEAEARLFGTAGGVAAAGEGLVRLVSGEFLGVVGRTVGLDVVRLEQGAEHRDIFDDPTLVSGDVDPAARLTLSKRLGSSVEMVYSQNLADEGFTWIANYLGPAGLSGRVLLFDDSSRSYEFRHEPFGTRRPGQARPERPRIDAVRIAGDMGFPEDELRRQLRLTEGDRFAFGDWQRDRDRLQRFYRSRGFLEARIRARRLPIDVSPTDDKVALEYTITRGPETELVIRGASVPDEVRERIITRWAGALFDGFLEKDARTIVRDHLYRQGYLGATVTTTIGREGSRQLKRLTIGVTPGAIVSSRLEVTGNSALPTEQLVAAVNAQDALAAWLDPGSVERLLEDRYRGEGYLAADVSVARPQIRDGASVVTITTIEGVPYSIGRLDLSGLPELPGQDPRETLALASGDRYRAAGVVEGVDRLEARLRGAAYRQASVDVETGVDAAAARVDVAVRVTPGPRAILRDVIVRGGDEGKPPVARSIVLAPNAPLDPAALVETRRRLYDLGVYRSVDIDIQPAAPSASSTAAEPPAEQPVVATIALEEAPRYRLRYGLAVSDEQVGPDQRDQRLGFAADFENRNVLSRAVSAGLSMRLRRDQQVGRATLAARQLFGLPIRSTLFVERKREQLQSEGTFPITADVTSFTAEQAYRVRRPIELRYGYGIERNHTFIRSEEADPFDLTVKIARLTAGGLVDRRDDPFNPARGWFVSSALELSTPGLGSDLKFLKDFVQLTHFVRAGKTGLVVASAARFGFARTFGDEVLIPSERFFAGGANSVRGYREDDLGARSIFGDAEGGSALVVLNGELRFPVYRWIKGVGFIDLGNVYPKVSAISFADLQIGTGAGARFDTPFGLIRLDLGIPANRRSFDPRWRLYIGLGHAF